MLFISFIFSSVLACEGASDYICQRLVEGAFFGNNGAQFCIQPWCDECSSSGRYTSSMDGLSPYASCLMNNLRSGMGCPQVGPGGPRKCP